MPEGPSIIFGILGTEVVAFSKNINYNGFLVKRRGTSYEKKDYATKDCINKDGQQKT